MATDVIRRQVVDEAAENAFLERDRRARATKPGRLTAGQRAGDATIEASLRATGRYSDPVPSDSGSQQRYGGRRSAEADRLAEASAAKVLGKIESGTQANQAATAPNAPRTHAVSAHGPGTDQEARLLHGRRPDQLAADKAEGKVGGYTTVGDEPSNTSGAFNSARGMLHAVTEGFAQANMVSAHADEALRDDRSKGIKDTSRIDADRFVTNVSGPSETESLGYNLSVEGVHSQTKGFGLAPDEVEQRRSRIKRDDDLHQARVVLDPAYVDGRRAGWNLQTAYANPDAATQQFATPGEVGGTLDSVRRTAEARAADVTRAEAAVKSAKDAVDAHPAQLELAKQAVTRLEGLLAGASVPTQASKKATLDDLAELNRELEKADVGDVGFSLFDDSAQPADEAPVDEEEIARIKGEVAVHEGYVKYWENQERLVEARKRVVEAEGKGVQLAEAVPRAEAALVAARERAAAAAATYAEAQKASPAKAADPDAAAGGSGPGVGVYNAATGELGNDRPSKPPNLKGTDETGDSLTAHHLYPWNRIREDLNDALRSRNRTELERLFAFGSVVIDDSFWTELAKEPPARSYAFTEQVNSAARQICWAPANVFMGPLGSKRGDDPGEGLDTAFTKSGLPTTASAAAELLARTGGLGESPERIASTLTEKCLDAAKVKTVAELPEEARKKLAGEIAIAQGKRRLAELIAANTRAAQDGEARPYDPNEWATDKDSKRVRAGQVPTGHRKEVPADLVELRDQIVTLGAQVASLQHQAEQLAESIDAAAKRLTT